MLFVAAGTESEQLRLVKRHPQQIGGKVGGIKPLARVQLPIGALFNKFITEE